MIGEAMIICDELSKMFDQNAGIRQVNLRFLPGRIYGVVGANGAGKTTLLRCLEGLYKPQSGSVQFEGVPTTDDRGFAQKRKQISYLPNEDYLYPRLSCRENITLFHILRQGSPRLSEDAEKCIDRFDLRPYLDKPFGLCSTGVKKKVQITASLAGNIEVFIWDEPNNGVDILGNIQIKELLGEYKQRGKTIILSSHVIEFLEHFVDTGIIIHEGEIKAIHEDGEGSLQEQYLRVLRGPERTGL